MFRGGASEGTAKVIPLYPSVKLGSPARGAVKERHAEGVVSTVVNTGELEVVGRFQGGVVDETVGVTSVQGWSGEAIPNEVLA